MATYVNKHDWNHKFCKHNYKVELGAFGNTFFANADCEQDAIDFVIDHCEKKAKGFLFTDKEVEELRQESLKDYGDERYVEQYTCGGNHGRYLNTDNVRITEVRD